MTKFRSIAALSAATIAFATLAACSGGGDAPKDDAPAATATTAAADANAAAAAAAPPEPQVAYASLTGDAAKGEKVFVQCKACHVRDEGVNRIGPSLHNIVGRKAGTVADFAYSEANKNSGVTWDEETLFKYLEAPQKFMPGTKMTFAGLKQPQDRADVIAYLKTGS